MAKASSTRGFWRGVLTGVALAAAIALALALAFPPTVFHAPEIGPEAQVAPAVTATPGAMAPLAAPRAGAALLRPAAAPLIADHPAADAPPDVRGLVPPATPEVFEGGSGGSPSLVPPQD